MQSKHFAENSAQGCQERPPTCLESRITLSLARSQSNLTLQKNGSAHDDLPFGLFPRAQSAIDPTRTRNFILWFARGFYVYKQ